MLQSMRSQRVGHNFERLNIDHHLRLSEMKMYGKYCGVTVRSKMLEGWGGIPSSVTSQLCDPGEMPSSD